MNNAIEIKGLTKHFPGFTLDGLDLVLPSGCILGLIGENGAGKSTTIKLLLGMLKPDAGSASVLGADIGGDLRPVKEEIGVVLDEPGLPHMLKAGQTDKIMGRISQNWSSGDFAALLRRLDLPEDKPYGDFSRGMKMKMGLAIALAHKAMELGYANYYEWMTLNDGLCTVALLRDDLSFLRLIEKYKYLWD